MSVARLTRRVLGKLRGRPTLEQLAADGLELGDGVTVAPRAYLDPSRPWLISIGEESTISDFAIVMTHDPRTRMLVGATRLGGVVIGRRVFVGLGAIILPGTNIGDDSVIDVRAVVSGEIAPGSFVSGNPGRIVGNVEAMAEACRDAAANRPTWPREGWSSDSGITGERKRAQRNALAEASEGYLRGSPRRVPQRG
jgi:acetyltransferase-like isoleucine patch superfamily enzyme